MMKGEGDGKREGGGFAGARGVSWGAEPASRGEGSGKEEGGGQEEREKEGGGGGGGGGGEGGEGGHTGPTPVTTSSTNYLIWRRRVKEGGGGRVEGHQSIMAAKGGFLFLCRLGFCECRFRLRTEENIILHPWTLQRCIWRRCTVL